MALLDFPSPASRQIRDRSTILWGVVLARPRLQRPFLFCSHRQYVRLVSIKRTVPQPVLTVKILLLQYTSTGGLASRRPGARLCVTLKPRQPPTTPPGPAKRPFPPPRGPPNHQPALPTQRTTCKTALERPILARSGYSDPQRPTATISEPSGETEFQRAIATIMNPLLRIYPTY